jgi:hypothetical protein
MAATSVALLLSGAAVAAPHVAQDTPRPLRLALLADPTDETAAPQPGPDAAATPVVDVAPDHTPPGHSRTQYGLVSQVRYVTVPSWFLDLFTKKNVPLNSWGATFGGFMRRGDFDLVISLSYQDMSPPDGNWLGKLNNATTDTDYVQVRGLWFAGADVSFIWHTWFTNWVGLHYGAGLGIAVIHGTVFRTSDGVGCTDANAGDINQCYPKGVVPTSSVTIDRQIQSLGPGVDDPNNPHRFADPNVPSVLPILNFMFGVDFRLPNLRGWEAKLEGGFYDAFFLGGGVGYSF